MSTENPQHPPEREVIAALEHKLEEMGNPSDAESILMSLANALFPEGLGEHHQTTWSDKAAHPTEPESAEARARAAEARFKTLVEQIPAVTFSAVLGEGKNEIYVSPHIEQMLGFTQKEWLEAPFLWYWQLHPEDRDLWNEEFARGCRTGGPFRAEARFIARDGHVVWVHGEARLVKDEHGRPLLLQGVAFDITEIKRAQEVLVKEATRKAKLEQETAIAHRVQTSILPRRIAVDGLEVAAVMKPADEVGGDYYDVLPSKTGAWFAVGDVSGHGLDSGLVMLMVQSGMAASVSAKSDATPRDVLVNLNSVVYDNIRSRLGQDDHITLSLLRYEPPGRFTFAGAHEEFVVWRKATRSIETVRTPGTWIGAMRDIDAVTVNSSFELAEGDLLVLYTDGIVEAMDASGEQFDMSRLSAAIAEVAEKPVQEICEHVMAKVRAFMARQDDDQSLMVIRCASQAVSARPVTSTFKALPKAASGAPVFPTKSIFDGVDAEVVAQLTVDAGTPTRLSSQGKIKNQSLGLKLSGVAEFPDQEPLEKLATAVHAIALERKVKLVEVDFRGLSFMNSSCFKVLVTWLKRAAELADGQGYKLRLVAAPDVRWQRASLNALVTFGGALISLGDAKP